jgi:hypothetical protein
MVPYQPVDEHNCGELHMHLTNTSLNSNWGKDESSEEDSDGEEESEEEDDEDEDEDEDDGEVGVRGGDDEEDEDDDEPADCKGLLSDVMKQLRESGVDTDALWREITRIVRLTLTAVRPPPPPLTSPKAPRPPTFRRGAGGAGSPRARTLVRHLLPEGRGDRGDGRP